MLAVERVKSKIYVSKMKSMRRKKEMKWKEIRVFTKEMNGLVSYQIQCRSSKEDLTVIMKRIEKIRNKRLSDFEYSNLFSFVWSHCFVIRVLITHLFAFRNLKSWKDIAYWPLKRKYQILRSNFSIFNK